MQQGERIVTIGMIGAGMVGQLAHLANFAAMAGCRVAALAELRPELGRVAAARFGVTRLYPSHRELLADPEIEAVVIVTRRPATGPIALDALKAGRHVLCEKPMAHSLAQARILVAAADEARRIFSVGFMKRHDAGVAWAKSLLDEARIDGRWGRLVTARCYNHGGDFAAGADRGGGFGMTDETRPDGLELWPSAPDWLPPDLTEDYAWFLNVFSHDLNLLRWLLGTTPKVVSADLKRRNGRFVLFDFGDFPGILEMAETGGEWREGVECVFEGATLTIECPAPLLRDTPARVTLVEKNGRRIVNSAQEPSWAFRRQAEAFIRDIAGARAPIASGRDSMEDLALAEEIWRHHLGRGSRT